MRAHKSARHGQFQEKGKKTPTIELNIFLSNIFSDGKNLTWLTICRSKKETCMYYVLHLVRVRRFFNNTFLSRMLENQSNFGFWRFPRELSNWNPILCKISLTKIKTGRQTNRRETSMFCVKHVDCSQKNFDSFLERHFKTFCKYSFLFLRRWPLSGT